MRLPAPLTNLLLRFSPWLLPIAAIAAFVELVGGGWDIQWHLARIPEVFWTPPHIVLYAGSVAVLASTGGMFALRWTPNPPPRSVRVGALVAFGGAALQLVSGGFDSTWHALYGADDALSPPHVMLTTALVITAVGIVIALHAWRRQEEAAGRSRAIDWVAHAIGFAAVAWACWGWLFILTFPGFNEGSRLIPSFGFRLLTGAAFAALLPLMVLASVRIVRRVGAGTVSAATQVVGLLVIGILMGDTIGGVQLLGIGLFILPGLAADFLYRPDRPRSLYVGVALGIVLGQFSFVQGGIVEAMTDPGAQPGWFAAAFAIGGSFGAFLAMALGRTADDLTSRDSAPVAVAA